MFRRIAFASCVWIALTASTCSSPRPVVQPQPPSPATIATWTAMCDGIWQSELGRPIDPAGLSGCLAQAQAGGTADTIRAGVDASPERAAYVAAHALPAPPTRDQILAGQLTFQGLTCQTQQYGTIPLFDPAIAWLDDPKDRAACYAVKRAAGDTIVALAISGAYREPGEAFADIPGKDFTQHLDQFHALIDEALANGMQGVDVMLAGDGEGSGPGYNDPAGLTYGHGWLMAHFAAIHAALADRDPYIVWYAGFDGWVPGWQPWSHVNDWLLYARSVIGPQGYLGLYLSAGYWVWSGETNDYLTPAGQALDQVAIELPYPMGPPDSSVPSDFCNQPDKVRAPFDQVWQVSNRLLGPLYRRPAEQPSCDDAKTFPPLPMTPRGPIVPVAREFDTYGSVRGLDPAVTVRRRAYLRSLGWSHVGLN